MSDLNFERCDRLIGVFKCGKTVSETVSVLVNLDALFVKSVEVEIDEVEVTLGGGVDATSKFCVELIRDRLDRSVDLHAHLSEVSTDFIRWKLEVLKECTGHIQEGFFGPSAEPIKSATVHQ